MSKWSNYGQMDTQVQTDGDPLFKGIDMLHDPGTVPPGYLARAENKRLLDGAAATRAGTVPAGESFHPGYEDTINGSHVFANPNGEEILLVSTRLATYVWALQDGQTPIQIEIDPADPDGNTGDAHVNFCQAFDKVLMFRWANVAVPPYRPLVWDGDPAGKFVPILVAPTGTGGTLIPRTWMGIPFENRVLLFNPASGGNFPALPGSDTFYMTDVLDYTQYDNVNGVFRVNSGESARITALVPYHQSGALIVFMKRSVHMIADFTIDPTMTAQRVVNGRLGGVGAFGPVMVGGDILFLSRPGGFYRLSQADNEAVLVHPTPISRGIQPLVDRILWDVAEIWHCSETLGEYIYFAVPLALEGDETPTTNNAILVLNGATGEFESAPDWWADHTFRINRLHTTIFNGVRRLFALDYAAKRVYVLEEGVWDNVNDVSASVPDVMDTRGYACGNPGAFKRFQRAVVGLRTWKPFNGEVTAIFDGHNETKTLAAINKDPLRTYLHDHEIYVPGTDDPDLIKREDYGDTDATVRKQQSLERFQIRQNGRWVSIRILNGSGGQTDVLGVAVEGIPGQETFRPLA